MFTQKSSCSKFKNISWILPFKKLSKTIFERVLEGKLSFKCDYLLEFHCDDVNVELSPLSPQIDDTFPVKRTEVFWLFVSSTITCGSLFGGGGVRVWFDSIFDFFGGLSECFRYADVFIVSYYIIVRSLCVLHFMFYALRNVLRNIYDDITVSGCGYVELVCNMQGLLGEELNVRAYKS